MISKKYKYDVAFSFCQEDEFLANEISQLFSNKINVFIYSKKQNELVGKDGEIEFKKTFSELSRVVVVLYREKYGKTTWTRIEEEAIRGRAYNEGYDFVLFIPLEEDKKTPIYLPKTRIYFNLDRFGPNGAANIISFIINEHGGNSTIITSEEKADRLKNKIDFDKKIKSYLLSNQAFEDSEQEIDSLIKIGQEKAETIFKGLNYGIETNPKRLLKIKFEKYLLQFHWILKSGNMIDDALLEITKWEFYNSNDPFEKGKYDNVSTDILYFNKNLNWENVWSEQNKNEYIKTHALIEKFISDFIDYIENQKFNTHDNDFLLDNSL